MGSNLFQCPTCRHVIYSGDNFCGACGGHLMWGEDFKMMLLEVAKDGTPQEKIVVVYAVGLN